MTVEEAYGHARLIGLQLLATLQEAAGSLDRVKRIVKLLGTVNGIPDLRTASQGHQRLLGPAGRGVPGTRASCALSGRARCSLPDNITVEIGAVIEIV